MSEYYKSLISDDDVIKELIKESKRREGKLLSEGGSRLKPNLNFFQRTVNSLVSNNSRIDKCTHSFKADHVKDPNIYKYPSVKKPLADYAFKRQLVLQTKINFVNSREVKQDKIAKIKQNRAAKPTSGRSKSKIFQDISQIERSNEIYQKPNLRELIDALSTDSDTSIESPNDRRKKKNSKGIFEIHGNDRLIENNLQTNCVSGGSGEIIFISSDDSCKEIAYREARCKKVKNKFTKEKRRKEASNKESGKNKAKAKRKKL